MILTLSLKELLAGEAAVRDHGREIRKRLAEHRRWIETDRIGYQCNRMVAYPSGCLHSATRHFGGGNDHGRLYQTFRVGVDWASFRAS